MSLYSYWKVRHKQAHDACRCYPRCNTPLCREYDGNDILKVGYKKDLGQRYGVNLKSFLWTKEAGGLAAEAYMHAHLATFLHPFGYGTRLPERFLCPPVITDEEIVHYLNYFYDRMPRTILYADEQRPMLPGNRYHQH